IDNLATKFSFFGVAPLGNWPAGSFRLAAIKLHSAWRRLRTRFTDLSLGYLNLSNPCRDSIHYVLVHLCLRHAGTLRYFEGVIAALNHVELCRQTQPFDQVLNLFLRSERVARALAKEHRVLDGRQMFIAQFVRTSRRV